MEGITYYKMLYRISERKKQSKSLIKRYEEGPLKLITKSQKGALEGKNHIERSRLEYIKQITKDQRCDSYLLLNAIDHFFY